jgi:hypothetical protein
MGMSGCPIFFSCGGGVIEKNFSEKEGKSLRISSKELRKRLVTLGNDTDIPCIIPCKICLRCIITSEDQ